jgi:hypothetical protein
MTISHFLPTIHTKPKNRTWSPTLATVLLCVASFTALAQTPTAPSTNEFSCSVLGRVGEQIRTGARVAEIPVRLLNCDGAVALSNAVSICFINESGVRDCRKLKKGEVVRRTTLKAKNIQSPYDSILAMLRGDVRMLPGFSREVSAIVGLPFGSVLGHKGTLRFDFTQEPRAKSVKHLRLTTDSDDDAATLWEGAVAGPTLDVPLKGIAPEAWYRWTAEGANEKFTGRFLLMGSTLDETRAELQRIDADKSISPLERLYLTAVLADTATVVLAHERNLAVIELRRLAGLK